MFDILSAFLSVWDNERPKWNGNLKGFLQRCILRKYLFLAFLLSELNWKQTENGCTLWHRDDRRAWERTSKMFNFRMHRPLNLKEAAPKCMQGISCRCFRHLATCKRSLGGRFGGQLGGSIGCRVGSGSGSGRESLRGRRSDKEQCAVCAAESEAQFPHSFCVHYAQLKKSQSTRRKKPKLIK